MFPCDEGGVYRLASVLMLIFTGHLASVASVLSLVLFFLSKKYREPSRKKDTLRWTCIWFGIFSIMFLIYMQDFLTVSLWLILPILTILIPVFIILHTASILSKSKITVPLWSLGISGPAFLFHASLATRIIHNGVASYLVFKSVIYPLFLTISILALLVIIVIKHRRAKREGG